MAGLSQQTSARVVAHEPRVEARVEEWGSQVSGDGRTIDLIKRRVACGESVGAEISLDEGAVASRHREQRFSRARLDGQIDVTEPQLDDRGAGDRFDGDRVPRSVRFGRGRNGRGATSEQ